MLFAKSPIGPIQIPSWEEDKVKNFSNEELLLKTYDENKKFVISPTTYAMIEKRQLGRVLQKIINSNIGMNHLTLEMISK